MAASIRYGLWNVLQIALGLLSTVVLYRSLYPMTWDILGVHAHGDEAWVYSLFSIHRDHVVVLMFFGLIVSELILWLPANLLERNRWLVLFSLVLLTTIYDPVAYMLLSLKPHKSTWFIKFFGLMRFVYLIRFQWRFIREKTYYDLLFCPVFLWVFDQFAIAFFYAFSGSDVQADDIGNFYALYLVPTLIIFPGLFPKEKIKYAVFFSLLAIGLCFSMIYNPAIMGCLVDYPKYYLPISLIRTFIIMCYVYIHLLLFSMLGRCFYYGPGWAMRVWRNRKRLWKPVSSN